MPRPGLDVVDPVELARAGERIDGTLAAARMPRIGAADGEVAYDLEFSVDGVGRPRIDGRVRGALELRCQRCLEAVRVSIDAPVALLVVASEAQAAALEEDGSVIASEGRLAIAPLVEDEAILALPVVASHPPGECAAPAGADAIEPEPRARTQRPFEALAALKTGPAADEASGDGEEPPHGGA